MDFLYTSNVVYQKRKRGLLVGLLGGKWKHFRAL